MSDRFPISYTWRAEVRKRAGVFTIGTGVLTGAFAAAELVSVLPKEERLLPTFVFVLLVGFIGLSRQSLKRSGVRLNVRLCASVALVVLPAVMLHIGGVFDERRRAAASLDDMMVGAMPGDIDNTGSNGTENAVRHGPLVLTLPPDNTAIEYDEITAQFDEATKTWLVPLVRSVGSRCTINFSIKPLMPMNSEDDNGKIKVEFVNFGEFTDVAMFQIKADKLGSDDRDRGALLRNGQETEIGIGDDEVIGFYFAIRDETNWNADKLLEKHPNAYIKVTLLQHPAP